MIFIKKYFFIEILERCEKFKLLKIINCLKKNYLKQQENINSTKVLNNYYKDYICQLKKMIMHGTVNYKWKNLNNLINLLKTSIYQKNVKKIEDIKKIEEIKKDIQTINRKIVQLNILRKKFEEKVSNEKTLKKQVANDEFITLIRLKGFDKYVNSC